MDKYTLVTQTWLSQKLKPQAFAIAALATFSLLLGSLLYWSNWQQAGSWLAASPEEVFTLKQYWQAWTTLFAHGDQKHLLSNAFLFFVFGGLLTSHFGLFLFPTMTFLFGGLINFLSLSTMHPNTHLIGASGMVFFMGGVWLSLYVALDLKKSLRGRLLRFCGVTLMLFFPAEAFDPSTSYKTHFFGFVLGLIFGAIYYFANRKRFLSRLIIQEIQEEIIEPVESGNASL